LTQIEAVTIDVVNGVARRLLTREYRTAVLGQSEMALPQGFRGHR
jgi:hypothetical protein